MKFVRIPAAVTLPPDGVQLGTSPHKPVKVFLRDDDTLEVYSQDATNAPIVLEFQAKLVEPYEGGFSAAAAQFVTEKGTVHVVDGAGCGCGFSIKRFNPEFG